MRTYHASSIVYKKRKKTKYICFSVIIVISSVTLGILSNIAFTLKKITPELKDAISSIQEIVPEVQDSLEDVIPSLKKLDEMNEVICSSSYFEEACNKNKVI